jgi:hypothetical protein
MDGIWLAWFLKYFAWMVFGWLGFMLLRHQADYLPHCNNRK